MRKPVVHVVDRREVHRRVLADRGVRAASRLDAHDALRRQHPRACQDQLIFLRVDVVRDHVEVIPVTEAPAERFDEGRLAGAHRTADPDSQGVRVRVLVSHKSHERNSLVYSVSCETDASSTITAAAPRSSRPAVMARSPASRTASSSAAIARCPSVWPRGISRTAAVTRLPTNACRKARRATSAGTPCAAERTAITTGRTAWI